MTEFEGRKILVRNLLSVQIILSQCSLDLWSKLTSSHICFSKIKLPDICSAERWLLAIGQECAEEVQPQLVYELG